MPETARIWPSGVNSSDTLRRRPVSSSWRSLSVRTSQMPHVVC